MQHAVVSQSEWLSARKELLAKEKKFTKPRDALSAARRELPWVKVEKNYVFDGPAGKQSLAELFDGRSQLIVYHFMFGPDWNAGCPHCSHWADNFNGIIVHLNQRDVTMLAVSRGLLRSSRPIANAWAGASNGCPRCENDFNFDFNVSFMPEEVAAKDALYNFVRAEPGSV